MHDYAGVEYIYIRCKKH